MNHTTRTISDFFPAVNNYLRGIRDIHHDDKLLEHCYANVWAREFDAHSVASYVFNLPAVSFREDNATFRELAIEKSKLFSEHLCLDPIFLYAHVGQGKTTYLRYLEKVRMLQDPALVSLADQVYFIYVEYTQSDAECKTIESDFRERLDDVIEKIFKDHGWCFDYDTLNAIFPVQTRTYERLNHDIARSTAKLHAYILEEDKAAPLGYFRHICKWLQSTHQIKVCCILDNVDRHLSAFDGERAVLRMFQQMSACFVQVIFALRIANRGFQYNEHFSALQPIPITLGLPDFVAVVQRRLAYIRRHYEQQLAGPILMGDQTTYKTAAEIFDGLEGICHVISRNPLVVRSMELLSNYITREYLDIMINLFSAEPLFRHPLTGKTINYTERISRGKFHSLFIYALMLRNNNELRDDDRSVPVLNLFSNCTGDTWTTFVRWYVLDYMFSNIQQDLTVQRVVEALHKDYGILQECIVNSLTALAKKQCVGIDTERQVEPERAEDAINTSNTRIMLSPRGVYHIELAKELEYYEVLALPRLRQTKRDHRELSQTHMGERGDNLLRFLESLKDEEAVLVKDHNRRSWFNHCWTSLMEEYKTVFQHNKPQDRTEETQNGPSSRLEYTLGAALTEYERTRKNDTE